MWESRSAAEALAEIAQRGAAPDLLLTDLVMPHMSGRQLAEQLHATHPATRVLYVSGYTDDDILRRGLVAPEAAFLEKPFSPTGLLEAVRKALES